MCKVICIDFGGKLLLFVLFSDKCKEQRTFKPEIAIYAPSKSASKNCLSCEIEAYFISHYCRFF